MNCPIYGFLKFKEETMKRTEMLQEVRKMGIENLLNMTRKVN
ncbi:MAG: hypothetical protein Q8P28_02230 [Deltaproteobacteria bacterium]|nr:hypothetical protein [Deltaproteobacteria bacterium]